MRFHASLAAVGMAVGVVGCWMLTRLLGGFLFGASPDDPVTSAPALVPMPIVDTAAGHVPARRASRIDPISALRMS